PPTGYPCLVDSRYDGFPALARFAGVAVLTAALGYRLFVQRRPLARDRITGWLLAYGVMVAAGVLYARAPDLVVTNVIEFVRCFFTYLIVINIITTSGRLHAALYTLMGAAVVLATLTLVQSLTGTFDQDFGGLAQYRVSDIAGDTEGARPGGTIGDANYYGQLLVIMIPVALYLLFEGRRIWKVVGLASAAILTAAVVFTYSRGDALALGAIVVAAVIYKRPNPLLLAGGVVALLLAVPLMPANYVARLATVVDVVEGNQMTIYGEDSIRGRAGATQAAIEMFAEHSFFGVGRENYPLYQLDYLSGTAFARVAKGIPPHNLYLEVAAEHGIMGLIVFGGVLVVSWLALVDARRRFKLVHAHREFELTGWLGIVLIGYLVTALFLHGAFLYILWLIISLIAAARQIAVAYTPTLTRSEMQVRMAQYQQLVTGSLPRLSTGRIANTLNDTTEQGALLPTAEAASTDGLTSREAGTPTAADAETALLADIKNWLVAGQIAYARGDYDVARAIAELALGREPYNPNAWEIIMRAKPAERGWETDMAMAGIDNSIAAEESKQVVYPVHEKLYSFWHTNGGLPVFGYAISPRFYEVSSRGEMVEVQYFERVRLEYHAARTGMPEEVRTGNIGHEVEIRGTPARILPAGLEGDDVIATVNGAQISIPRLFVNFREAIGGREVVGMPTTEVLIDRDDEDRAIWVQYFDKARFEYDPDRIGTIYEVRLTRLGADVFRSKYGRNRQQGYNTGVPSH
ncbi:MAG: O-antigen ligase family protein, partial [Chloroflexota bacterium]